MDRHVNAIAGRLSLRPPQRQSLEILDRITEISPPKKDSDIQAALDAIQSEYPSVTDFEREFPSVCFALATGVGKTRLMGAFISYLKVGNAGVRPAICDSRHKHLWCALPQKCSELRFAKRFE
jgi:type III restriction enzyme